MMNFVVRSINGPFHALYMEFHHCVLNDLQYDLKYWDYCDLTHNVDPLVAFGSRCQEMTSYAACHIIQIVLESTMVECSDD